jgi:hypothetical protein
MATMEMVRAATGMSLAADAHEAGRRAALDALDGWQNATLTAL